MPKHKHNANEGERCTYRTPKTKTHSKRPLLLSITTAFILLSPTASGVALASSLYGTGHTQPQKSALGLTTSQHLALPKTNPGRLLPALNTPSKSDIDTLESNITQAQKQLDTLSNQLPKDQTQLEALKAAIRVVQARLDQLITNLQEAKENYAQYLKAQSTLSSALEKYNAALLNENNLTLTLTQATSNHDAALLALNNQIVITASAKEALDQAKSAFTQATLELTQEREALSLQQLLTTNAKSELDSATASNQTLTQLYNNASTTYSEAQAALFQADFSLSQAYAAHNQAQSNLNQAQYNYDNNLIPDPTWTPPTYQKENTRLVPYTEIQLVRTLVPTTTTTLQEQVIPNLLPNPALTSTEGWSGVYPGWQGSQPGMYDGEITFSYMYQTVTQGLYSGPFENATLTLSADWYSDWTADSYSMTVTAEDINRNPVGTATYTNTRTAHDWINRSVTLEATGPVSYITVSFSGIDHGFWYGMYGPRMKNPALEVSYGQYVTETTYEEVITYEEVTKYREEIYYTTEVIQPQQGLTVRVYNNLPTSNPLRSDTAYNLCKTTTLTSINHQWGGGDILGCGSDRVMIHYTGYITPTENITSLRGLADDGFYLDINGVNAINNWTLKGCGGNWNPVNLQAGQSYAIDAWFYEWGGGACSILNYQSASGEGVVPEAWYSNGASAPLIKDPALIAPLQEAQVARDLALLNLQQEQSKQEASQESFSTAGQLLTNAQEALNNSDAALEEANQAYLEAQTQLSTNKSKVAEAEQKTNTAQEDLSSKELTHTSNEQTLLTTQQTEQSALTTKTTTEVELAQARTLTTAASTEKALAESTLTTAEEYTATSYQAVATLSLPDLTPVQEILDTEPVPIPEPEPEEQGSAEIPEVIENLMDVNLAAVDPTELTEAQAEQLVEAALVVFETAEEGSPEYEQALDALFLAAEQDDIQVDPALADIPGVGEAAKAVVAIFNLVGNVGADISPKAREKAQTLVVTTLVVGQIAQAAAMASASSGSSFRRK